MKMKISLRPIFLIVAISIGPNIFGGVNTFADIIVSLTKDLEPSPKEQDPSKHRSQRQTAQCLISRDSLEIANYDATDIIFYEVYDQQGELLCAFSDEQEFISFIFSSDEAMEIRFVFSDFSLSGFL